MMVENAWPSYSYYHKKETTRHYVTPNENIHITYETFQIKFKKKYNLPEGKGDGKR